MSNFFPVNIQSRHLTFPSVEHAYVAAKSTDKAVWEHVATLTAGQAKRFGRELEIRQDWDERKLEFMTILVRRKFAHPFMMKMLQDTGGAEIVEGNFWHDNFWGNCSCSKCVNIPGVNNLGRILMEIRDDI